MKKNKESLAQQFISDIKAGAKKTGFTVNQILAMKTAKINTTKKK